MKKPRLQTETGAFERPEVLVVVPGLGFLFAALLLGTLCQLLGNGSNDKVTLSFRVNANGLVLYVKLTCFRIP